MTNEEMIKSMSQDDLAEFINNLFIIGRNFNQPPPYCYEPCHSSSCYSCAYYWLEEEAPNG